MMKRSPLALLPAFILAVLISALPVSAAAQTPTIDQSLGFKSASTARISPDGRFVAYQVSETNWADNAFETEIWIASVATGTCASFEKSLILSIGTYYANATLLMHSAARSPSFRSPCNRYPRSGPPTTPTCEVTV